MADASHSPGIEFTGTLSQDYQQVLTPQAQALLVELHRRFEP